MELGEPNTRSEWRAYVAGFFDGEGTIMITRRSASRSGYPDNHQVWIGLAQRIDHRDVLDDMRTTFGGMVRVLDRNKRNPRWSNIAQWELIARAPQRAFLLAVYPYLRIKRTQADVALDFLDAVQAYGRTWRRADSDGRFAGTRPLTEQQVSEREAFRQRMILLNRVGPRE